VTILLKDLTKGQLSKEWLNRLIKDSEHDAVPTEKGEKDKLWRQKEDSTFLPKTRRKGKR